MDANRDLRMSDLLVYRNLDDDHHGVLVDHCMNVPDDPNLDVKTVVNRGRRMNDRLDDHSMDGNHVNRRSGVHPNAQLV